MTEWACRHCGYQLAEDASVIPCPGCGKTGRVTALVIEEAVEVLPAMRIQKKSPGYPSGKKVRVDLFSGMGFTQGYGRLREEGPAYRQGHGHV